MVIKHEVTGYDQFIKFVNQFQKDDIVNICFTGNLSGGESWCPDCNNAKPLVEKALEKAPANSHFIIVYVGERDAWKDPKNPFRQDKDAKLMVIPTIIRWKSPLRLEGPHCEKHELLEMFFEDDDE